jgi:hypothetical protein
MNLNTDINKIININNNIPTNINTNLYVITKENISINKIIPVNEPTPAMTCLISKEPIKNEICLPCKHSYEYEYLYEEIKQQKNRHKNYFKCPYCRCIYHSCIPYYEIENVERIKNINLGNILHIFDCSNNNCKCPGNKFKNGNFCWKHYSKSIIVIETCKAICLNGNVCKNKRKTGDYCNIHKNK